MTDIEILKFDDALQRANGHKHVLLGNGFSIALKPDIFSYSSLFERADFSKVPHSAALFDALNTRDFEAVIRLLVDMARALSAYEEASPKLIEEVGQDADAIKEILATAIAQNHPDRPYDIEPAQYAACRRFLSNFERIYSLNYDVLLYWALMHDDVDTLKLHSDDGFRHPEGNEDAPYVSWQDAHSATVLFLHGALHLFDAGHEITKYTWSKTDIAIIDQVRAALNEGKYPLFVAEGHSQAKLKKIMHSAYLHRALRSFASIGGSLFVYGHSFDDNDFHILKQIPNGKTTDLFVSIYGNPNSDSNKSIISRAYLLQKMRSENPRKRELNIHFYDAESAHVWGISKCA